MNINIIDTVNKFVELRLKKHEILTICHALSKMKECLTEEDKWLLTEINGISDILKDGNFTRFLSFEKGKWEQEQGVAE